MLVVAFVSFSLFTFVGDPINNMVGEETSEKERAELRVTLGLNDAIPVQFVRFIKNASKGEFGISYQLRRPVQMRRKKFKYHLVLQPQEMLSFQMFSKI